MNTARTVTNVGVLDKALELLEILSQETSDLSDLVRRTGYSRATTHRLLRSLTCHGLVSRDAAGHYRLGARLTLLGERATSQTPLAELARPALVKLQAETGEGAQLYVKSGSQRVCLASVDSTHNLREIVPVGTLLPLESGSAGRVLRGEVPPSGFVSTVEERAVGVASVSAPIHSRSGDVIAALSVSGPVSRMTRRPGRRHGAAVVRAARRVERALA